MSERLHKVLAHAGVASRRAAEQMIRARRVRVNGTLVLEMGTQVDPERDAIEVDGRRLANAGPRAQHVYVALNKPLGVVSTASDPEQRRTVVEMVNAGVRLYPVGRLDIDSEGLVLLTDDGELTYRLTQARFAVEKEYHVLVDGPDLEGRVLDSMRAGVRLQDGLARVVRTSFLRTTPGGGGLVRVVLVEGRKRQVRRMFSALGCVVEGLQRVRIGPLQLGDLEPGEHRALTSREIGALRSTVGLDYRVFTPSAGGPIRSGSRSTPSRALSPSAPQPTPSNGPTPRGPQSIRSGTPAPSGPQSIPSGTLTRSGRLSPGDPQSISSGTPTPGDRQSISSGTLTPSSPLSHPSGALARSDRQSIPSGMPPPSDPQAIPSGTLSLSDPQSIPSGTLTPSGRLSLRAPQSIRSGGC